MNANRTKIILYAIGGVVAVATLVLLGMSYMSWSTSSERQFDIDGLQSRMNGFRRAKIAPTVQAEEALAQNENELKKWYGKAFEVVSSGDTLPQAEEPLELQTRMRNEAQELAQRPGLAEGKFVKADFTFGFKEELIDGKTPERSAVPELQRRWNDVSALLTILADSGVGEVQEIVPLPYQAQEETSTRRPAPRKGVKGKPAPTLTLSERSYTVKFVAQPTALLQALNTLAKAPRIMTVDEMVFSRAADQVAQLIAPQKEKRATPSRRRRGAARVAEAEQDEDKEKASGVIVDAQTAEPFTVSLKVTSVDLGTKSKTSEEEESK